MEKILDKLYTQGKVKEQSYLRLKAHYQNSLISVNYELRFILYLGIMMFTGAVGYLVYQNIGSIGHILAMTSLLVCIGLGFYYLQSKALPYSHTESQVDHIYFDYTVVLTALLIISLFTYALVYFDLALTFFRWTSLISAVVFLFMAYRYDNKMLLSLGITAFAAVFGISLSINNWIDGEWTDPSQISYVSIGLACALIMTSFILEYQKIKTHFTFTYQNFGILLFYFGGLSLIFEYFDLALPSLLLLAIATGICIYTWFQKQFLFFLYSCITGYIALTTLLIALDLEFVFYVMYFPVTLITAIILLVKNKKHFAEDE